MMNDTHTKWIAVLAVAVVSLSATAQEAADIETARPLDIILVLDNSGSMKNNDPGFLTREVVKNFVEKLKTNVQLGMIVFDKSARIVCPLAPLGQQNERTAFLEGLAEVDYSGLLTNSPDGIERAIYAFRQSGRSEAEKCIVFVTDGIVDTGDKATDAKKAAWVKEDLCREARERGVKIFAVAFTEAADYAFIQSIASRTGGNYFRALSSEDISRVFEEIHNTLYTKPEPEIEPEAQAESAGAEQTEAAEIEETTPAAPVQPLATPAPVPSVQQQAPEPPPSPKTTDTALLLSLAALVLVAAVVTPAIVISRKKAAKASLARPEVEWPDAYLLNTDKTFFGEAKPLNKTPMRIGRGKDNDIALDDSAISFQHAQIEFEESTGIFYLRDLGSTNRTRLDGEELESGKRYMLRSGNFIEISKFKFQFLVADYSQTACVDSDESALQTISDEHEEADAENIPDEPEQQHPVSAGDEPTGAPHEEISDSELGDEPADAAPEGRPEFATSYESREELAEDVSPAEDGPEQSAQSSQPETPPQGSEADETRQAGARERQDASAPAPEVDAEQEEKPATSEHASSAVPDSSEEEPAPGSGENAAEESAQPPSEQNDDSAQGGVMETIPLSNSSNDPAGSDAQKSSASDIGMSPFEVESNRPLDDSGDVDLGSSSGTWSTSDSDDDLPEEKDS